MHVASLESLNNQAALDQYAMMNPQMMQYYQPGYEYMQPMYYNQYYNYYQQPAQ
jgi:hypothetical protein